MCISVRTSPNQLAMRRKKPGFLSDFLEALALLSALAWEALEEEAGCAAS